MKVAARRADLQLVTHLNVVMEVIRRASRWIGVSTHFKSFLVESEPALSDTPEFMLELFGQAFWPAEPDF